MVHVCADEFDVCANGVSKQNACGEKCGVPLGLPIGARSYMSRSLPREVHRTPALGNTLVTTSPPEEVVVVQVERPRPSGVRSGLRMLSMSREMRTEARLGSTVSGKSESKIRSGSYTLASVLVTPLIRAYS